jgi:hypothetical protein
MTAVRERERAIEKLKPCVLDELSPALPAESQQVMVEAFLKTLTEEREVLLKEVASVSLKHDSHGSYELQMERMES